MYHSLFSNLKSPKVIGQETTDNILQMILNGYTKETVVPARAAGKGTELYERLKASTPTWSPNASFTSKRIKGDIQALSGFIYLDVEEDIDLTEISRIPFVYAAWKSFSGVGYGILVKVDNLTIYCFQSVWLYMEQYFCQKNNKLDAKTKDATRQNVISYDPNLYKNPHCVALDANSIVTNNTATISAFDWDYSGFNIPAKDYQSSCTYNFDTNITFKTVLNDYEGKDYVVIAEGKGFRHCYLPIAVKEGQRDYRLWGYAKSLLYINPSIDCDNLLKIVLHANKRHMSPPLSQKEVENIVRNLYNKHQGGWLNYNPKLKKIWINPDAELTTKEKKQIIGKESGKLKKAKTLGLLIDCYMNLSMKHDKITQKMVKDASGKSLRTVKHYWHEIVR